jgi:hypothetical protein
MLAAGLVAGGLGVATLLEPRLVAWTVGGAALLFGGCLVSIALFARGRGPRP